MAFLGREIGTVLSHHVQKAVCDSRAKYRDGRRPRAVKVYTVNLESQYLLIQGVPAVGAMKELVERFALYGAIEQYNALDEYPAEDFTEVYLIKFTRLQSARMAKRKMDEQSFFGGLLHVCYAPEFETVEETRKKLSERKTYIENVTRNNDSMTRQKLNTKTKDTRDSTQDFQAETSGFRAATWKNAGNLDPCLPYSCELPLCYFSSKCKCSSRKHVNRAPESSQEGGKCSKTVVHCNHSDSEQRKQTKTWASSATCPHAKQTKTWTSSAACPRSPQTQTWTSSVACPHSQVVAPPSEAVDRFMPRTTQLQERKRRREDDRKRGAVPETSTSSNEVLIGPQLPDIPKVDLHDDSLNTTANLIRNKLKEVISAVPKPPGEKLEDVHISHPVKQRRRI